MYVYCELIHFDFPHFLHLVLFLWGVPVSNQSIGMCRSEVQLERLGDQLASDFTRIGANEEDLSIDIVSNGENAGFISIAKWNVQQNDASSPRKGLHVEQDAIEESEQGVL